MALDSYPKSSGKLFNRSIAAAQRIARDYPVKEMSSDPIKVNEIFATFQARLTRITEPAGILVIEFGSDSLTIDASSLPANVYRGAGRGADSTVSIHASTLSEILAGSFSATRAFLHGQLKVNGSFEVLSGLRALWKR